jgi:hypothetical protein
MGLHRVLVYTSSARLAPQIAKSTSAMGDFDSDRLRAKETLFCSLGRPLSMFASSSAPCGCCLLQQMHGLDAVDAVDAVDEGAQLRLIQLSLSEAPTR